MDIISKIRFRFYDSHLNKKLTQIKSSRSSVEFENAKTIGILFDATDSKNRNRVLKYADSLEKNGKKVHLFGFVNTTEKDLSFSFKFFTKKEVDWRMVPRSLEVDDFSNKQFDILINLYLDKNESLEFISALSRAKLRVGPHTDNPHCFDLSIDTINKTDISNLIKQIDFFLNRVNSPVYEEVV